MYTYIPYIIQSICMLQNVMPSQKLIIILPCYNEKDVLLQTVPVILSHLQALIDTGNINGDSHLLLVDDGSKDDTWSDIQHLKNSFPNSIKALKLTRNFGHQNAVFAGMMHAKNHLHADICISMDCDLQDDPSILADMITEYNNGHEIVYGVRNNRQSDTRAKRGFAEMYYLILSKLGIEIVPNHADYRLLSKKALTALAQFDEKNLFLRGIVPLLGFKSTNVYYKREERVAGYSKYDIRRMVRLAVNGICSFSSAPLMFILWLGMLVSIASLIMGIWALIIKIFGFGTVPGWASTVVPMYFLGGVQLLTLGVIGIYVGKIFDEVKQRPKYLIEQEL